MRQKEKVSVDEAIKIYKSNTGKNPFNGKKIMEKKGNICRSCNGRNSRQIDLEEWTVYPKTNNK